MLALSGALSLWFLLGYQSGGMHLPALLAAVLTFILAVGLFVSGLIADGISTSHRLLEDVLYHVRRLEQERLREIDELETFAPLHTGSATLGSH
jgi:hypothetical protein